jgi:hypothetical protein
MKSTKTNGTPRDASHETLNEICLPDVHQSTTTAAVREESGRVIARTILPTKQQALIERTKG